MTNNHVKMSLMSSYKINDVKVDIFFSPKVIEAFATKDEINQVNNIEAYTEIDLDELESHFEKIFNIIKKRVVEFETYTMFFDTIEYENVELIWKSSFHNELKLMEINVSYSQMNDPNYRQILIDTTNSFHQAQENGKDMNEWIKRHQNNNLKEGENPLIVGMIPEPKKRLFTKIKRGLIPSFFYLLIYRIFNNKFCLV